MAIAAAPSTKPGAFISEVVVQGIRRFGDVRRFTLAPGYNVLYGLSAAGKSTVFEVLLSLLFAKPPQGARGGAPSSPEDVTSEAESFKSLLPQGASACRAGISLNLNGETFRILKDYQQGAVTLSRLIAAERRFELVASDPAPIQSWLTANGISSGPAFSRLFTMTSSDFPSRTEGAVIAPIRKDAVDTGFEDRIRAMSLPNKKSLCAQLLDEFRRNAEVKTSEFLQDGLRTKLFEVEALIRKRDEAREKIAEIDLEIKDIAKVPKLPDGIDDRIESYKRQEKNKESELENLIPRQEDAHNALEAIVPAPFTSKEFRKLSRGTPLDLVLALLKKDRQVDAGIAMLVLIGPIFLIIGGFWAYVGMAIVVAGLFMVGYFGLFKFLGAKEKFDGLVKSVDQIDEQVKLVERKWDIETTIVRNLMKAYAVDDPREMREIEKTRDVGSAKKTALEESVAALVLANGEKDLDAAHARIQAQITSIDERMQQMSGRLTTDPKELEPQIERLDRDIARAEGRKSTPKSKLFGREEDLSGDDSEQRNAIVSCVETWCAARQADMGKLLRAAQDAFSKNVRAISGGRFADGQFDATGSVSLREENRGSVPFESVDAIGKDAAYLALRVTLLQLETRGSSRPIVVLDDPFDFEEGRLELISRALKALGPDAQVLHLTSRPVHQRLADHQLEI